MAESVQFIHLRKPHQIQGEFIQCEKPRIIIRAGRRGGKTVGISQRAVLRFAVDKKRVLYAAPTAEQLHRFWFECKKALQEPIDMGILKVNESEHFIEVPGTLQRIRAKTAWNADTLRGDYADELILDEWQLMDEEAWEVVGAPMLADHNGNAVFIYTPASLHSRSASKARDPLHAAKMYKAAKADTTGRWAYFHFTSLDNPYISQEAVTDLAQDMTPTAYRQEILAEDIDESPGALWKRETLDSLRVKLAPELTRIVTGVDPSATRDGDEAGVITAGVGFCSCNGQPEKHAFVLADNSIQARPELWAKAAVDAHHAHAGDCIVAEDNNGGEMVEVTFRTIAGAPPVKRIHASRGKIARAEPIALLTTQGKVHFVGHFPKLEDELCTFDGSLGQPSPNRYDAFVWAISELGLKPSWNMEKYAAMVAEIHEREERECLPH